MTQLQITLQQPMADGSLIAGAVATVRRLAGPDGKLLKRWWSNEMPVDIVGADMSQARPAVFDLPGGGTYDIEITRPRGPAITREYEIAQGERRPETIILEASPHEYLSWHQYAGIVRSDPFQREQVRLGFAKGSVRMEKLVEQGQELIDSLYRNVGTVPQVFAAKLPASYQAWEMVTKASRTGNTDWASVKPLNDYMPDQDAEYATWFLGAPGPQEGIDLIAGLKRVDPPSGAAQEKYPRWMAFETGHQINLASIPWPWWGAHNEDHGEIRVVYDRARPNAVERDQPGRLNVNVLDNRWFGMLEFLASGRLNRTRKIFEKVIAQEEPEALFNPEMALYGKVKGPLVASAGAIVLIASAQSTEKQIWDPWINNLSRWFPGIPDGAILLGCRRVAQATTLNELEAAFNHLRDGIERGIPFFSATVRMLLVSLSQIGGDVSGADEMRRIVAPVATRIDPDQVFTVFRL
jgi:hypothetical protein